jgi:signal transduction histidine kinase
VTNAQAGLDWLGADPPNLTQVRQTLNYIVNDGMRASEVIDRIRSLIKKAPPKRESLQLNRTVLEVTALTRGEVLKNRVRVRTQLDESLPPVQADPVQLQQVLLNLIINAIEAMRGVAEGSRELLIATGRTDDGSIVVSLRDTGSGLDPKQADRLFEPFFTTKLEGMGMGLAICRSIIEAHGGRLWASANEPRGAVFRFTLPLEPVDAIAAGHPSLATAGSYLPRS